MHGPAGIPETRFHFKTRSVEVWPRREHLHLFVCILRHTTGIVQKASLYSMLGKAGSMTLRSRMVSEKCVDGSGIPIRHNFPFSRLCSACGLRVKCMFPRNRTFYSVGLQKQIFGGDLQSQRKRNVLRQTKKLQVAFLPLRKPEL